MDKCKKFAYSTHLLLNILTIINYIVGDDKTLRFMCDAWKVGRSNILLTPVPTTGVFAYSAFLESSSS